MDNFNIEMPDDLEIKSQINMILDKGLESKESFYSYVKQMYKNIGFKNLFHDSSELIFIGVLIVSLLIFGVNLIKRDITISKEMIYTYIFIISPLYYLATNIFTLINLKENNTFETEMVCKYNLYQISALRMLVFSVISILLSSVFTIALYSKIDVFRGLMISITSIFLFSAILLFSIVRVKSNIVRYAVIASWIVINGALFRMSTNEYFVFLETMPVVVYAGVTIVSAWVYFRNIEILVSYKKFA